MTPKYRGFKDPIDGRPMFWGVHPDGYPIREGDAPALVDQKQLGAAESIRFFRSQQFKIPEDQEKYVETMDWIANTGVPWYDERIRDVPGTSDQWTVWLRWIDVRGVIPTTPKS